MTATIILPMLSCKTVKEWILRSLFSLEGVFVSKGVLLHDVEGSAISVFTWRKATCLLSSQKCQNLTENYYIYYHENIKTPRHAWALLIVSSLFTAVAKPSSSSSITGQQWFHKEVSFCPKIAGDKEFTIHSRIRCDAFSKKFRYGLRLTAFCLLAFIDFISRDQSR